MLVRLAAAAAVLAFLSAGSFAQEQPPPPARLATGPLVFKFSGASLQTLLQRPEVRTHLDLNMRQRAELDELFSSKNPQRVAITLRGSAEQSPEDLRKQAEEQMRAQLGDRDAKIKAILRAEQWSRLLELDAQWRGPLALADADVAKRIELSADHAAQIREIAQRYAARKQEVLASLSQTNEQASPDGSKRIATVRIDTSKLDNKLSPEYQTLSASKKEAEAQIKAVLSAEERSRWQAAQGAPFLFRDDHPSQRL